MTQQNTLPSFPRELAQEMWNSNVGFEAILHVPTLSVLKPSDEFKEFCESCHDGILQPLTEQCPAFSYVLNMMQEDENGEYDDEHASNLSLYCSDFEFLVKTQTAIPTRFNFTDEGEFQSCSIGGWYQNNWFFAKDMKHAAQQAIACAQEIFDKKMLDAKEKLKDGDASK
ncbi:hypothetical protein [Acinetobacter sp. ANC 5378]|uniref:hypothetical protein n=1 Tax=Acinetobacter sp. ANC 5378 TaxID=2731249 RepID=UPI00148F9067|nr:hypothetical protein [Acinetobacter sp. ANC 5378]NNG82813.1 hypothetical protein [Acinetobacter sp. ANC 5378]